VSSSRLIPSLLTCHLGKFFSTVFISSEHWSTCLISSKFRLNSSQLFPTRDSSHCQRELSCTNKSLGAESFCTQKLGTQMHLHRKAFTEYFVLQSLHKVLPSTTLYYKACTQLAQSTSQYYFVLQSLYTACTEHFPVLLCTAKFAQSTSQYYFVLQILHKALRSITLYTKHFPVLLCTTKLAQICTKHFPVLLCITMVAPVLLCTTKLAQSTSQYYFVLQSLHKACTKF